MLDQLLEIARLRADGARHLEAIAQEGGADSVLYRCCREVWFERESGADQSVVAGDWRNAIVLLQLGLHVLIHGPDVLRRDGLRLADAVSLLRAA